ncbi:hypothetical protein BWD07_12350, partial [Neisseria canis]
VVAVAVGVAFGFRGKTMGGGFLMSGPPGGAARPVVGETMGGNRVGGAQINRLSPGGGIFFARGGGGFSKFVYLP